MRTLLTIAAVALGLSVLLPPVGMAADGITGDAADPIAGPLTRLAVAARIGEPVDMAAVHLAIETVRQAAADPRISAAARGRLLLRIALAYEAIGDGPSWRLAADEASRIFTDLLATDPADDEFRAGWAESLLSRGEMYRTDGDVGAALPLFEQALADLEQLAAARPDDLSLLHLHALAKVRIGKVRFALGNTVGAIAIFEDAITISQRLVALAPDNLEYRYELFACYANIGFVRRAAGNEAAAVAPLEKARALIEDLIARHPGNRTWRADLDLVEDTLGRLRGPDGGAPHAGL